MDVVEDSAKREAMAQRMSRLLGLPITSIQLLMPKISKDELSLLESLPDDQFLSEATKTINMAQKRQAGDGAAGSAGGPQKPKLQRKSAENDDQGESEELPSPDDAVGADGDNLSSAFSRPVEKPSPLKDKKIQIAIAAGGGAFLLLIILVVVWLVFLRGEDEPDMDLASLAGVENINDLPPEAPDEPVAVSTSDATPTFTHQGVLSVGDTGEVVAVDLPTQMVGAITAEFWVSPVEGQTGSQEVFVSGESATGLETFRLSFERDVNGDFYCSFSVPQASEDVASYKLYPVPAGEWLHVAGVYDPYNKRTISVFAGGMKVRTVECSNTASDMSTSSIRFATTVRNGSSMLVDELRVDNAPSYGTDFQTARIAEKTPNTRVLLHFEKWDDAMVYNAADMKKLNLISGLTKEMPDSISAPIFQVKLKPIELPEKVKLVLADKMGDSFLIKFEREWQGKTRSERIEYLRSIKYPVEKLLQE